MQYAGWMKTALLVSVVAAGCGSSGKVGARKKLAEQVEKARRLYGHASAIVANPVYIDKVTGRHVALDQTVILKDRTRVSGQVTAAGRKYRIKTRDGRTEEVPAGRVEDIVAFETPEADVEVTTRPVEIDQALGLLEQARSLVSNALRANPKAPVGVKADASQLLGDIELARGNLFDTSAETRRGRAGELRRHARWQIGVTRNYAVLRDFNRSLATMSRKKILEGRDQAQKQLVAVNARIKTIDTSIGERRKEMTTLTAKNAELLKEIRSLRDASEREEGAKGLDLLRQAHNRQRTKNRNQAAIDAARAQIANLSVDKSFEEANAAAARAKLKVMEDRLTAMDQRKQVAEEAVRQAEADMDRSFKQVQALAEQIVRLCKQSFEKEAAALKGLDRAVGHLGDAETHVRAERSAAGKLRGDKSGAAAEITKTLADDKHVAAIIAARASAALALGELRSRQLSTTKANGELAKAITDLAKQVERDTPAVVEELKAYLADEAGTRKLAVGNYEQAETDLEQRVLQTHLRDSIGRNIRWMYEGQLADTYLGHYRLTGDAEVLKKAGKWVDEAARGKDKSELARSVVLLQALVRAAGG